MKVVVKIKQFNRQAILRLCSCILFCCISAGCGKSEVANSSESSISQNSEISSSIKSDLPLEEMDYDEYFSKERKWIDESLAVDNGYFYDVKEDGSVVRFKFSLTNEQIDQTTISDQLGSVSDYAVVYGKPIFIVDHHKIIQTDENGENQQFIYEDPFPIDHILASRELIYFVRENSNFTILRLHRKSGVADELISSTEEISSYRPLSNYTIRWSVFTEEWKEFLKTGKLWEDAPPGIRQSDSYFYNSKTGEKREIEDSDYDADGFLKYTIEEN